MSFCSSFKAVTTNEYIDPGCFTLTFGDQERSIIQFEIQNLKYCIKTSSLALIWNCASSSPQLPMNVFSTIRILVQYEVICHNYFFCNHPARLKIPPENHEDSIYFLVGSIPYIYTTCIWCSIWVMSQPLIMG